MNSKKMPAAKLKRGMWIEFAGAVHEIIAVERHVDDFDVFIHLATHQPLGARSNALLTVVDF